MAIITPQQAREMHKSIGPKYGYLVRLRERMEKAAMTMDPLFSVVSAAEEAMQRLSVLMHYRSCEHGVGLPPATGKDEPAG